MAAANDIFGSDYFRVILCRMVPWVGSGIELWQFPRIFLLIFSFLSLHNLVSDKNHLNTAYYEKQIKFHF